MTIDKDYRVRRKRVQIQTNPAYTLSASGRSAIRRETVAQLEARRDDCAPVAGKSTLNRLELSRLEPTRYHKISHNPVAIKLLVDLFVEARAPKQIILDLDATDDPLHGQQEGRFCYCYLPLYVFCGRHLLAAKLRPANMEGIVPLNVEIGEAAFTCGPATCFPSGS
jgi:hypothetical protein